MQTSRWTLALILAMTGGCYIGSNSSPIDPGTSSGGSTGSTGNAAAGSNASAGATTIDPTASGLPCDVTALLQHYCVGCHSSPPTGGAPQALTSYDSMVANATTDPTKKIGPLSLELLQSGVMPPKPAAVPSATEIAALQTWVNGGMAKATCTTAIDPGTIAKSPYDTPLQCSSMSNWTQGDHGSSSMHPGGKCISCHSMGGDGPIYAIAGTVYATAHEPDDCNGKSTTATGALSVVITDASGAKHTLPVNSVGNFYLKGTIATPYTAEVISGTSSRVMTHTQTSGDCNSCHTVNGSANATNAVAAPGRIMAP